MTTSSKLQNLKSEVSKLIVGQQEMVDGILMGLLTGGHILLEGVPGLAKTLAISTVARCVSLQFHRVQFTPDLLPTDLIGTMILNPKTLEFSPKKGPLFTNILLADEINRAPAKVQSALLEAMAEKQVTLGDESYKLDRPFLVLATQNPLEQEGTYPLPEAQMDRFMFKLRVTYPTRSEEMEIIDRVGGAHLPELQSVITKEEILQLSEKVENVYVDKRIKSYLVDLVMATRQPREFGLSRLENFIELGASPRATLALLRASKAQAFLAGREFVTAQDVLAIAYPVFRHRILLTFEADADNVTSDSLIKDILSSVEVP